MADFTITIANDLNVFGQAPSSKWNVFAYGSFLWGEGTAEIVHGIEKVLAETLSLADSVSKSADRTISETLSPTSETISEYLIDTEGYYKVFPGQVTNADSRVSTSWAQATTTTSWTSGTATSTSWTHTA